MNRKIAIIGLSRFASQLARHLYRDGIEVIVVDINAVKIEQISDEVTIAVQMDCTDIDALRSQGIDQVDVAVIGVRENFETVVLAAMILKELGVKQVYCRAEQQIHADILKRVGADEVIMPEDEAASRWSNRLGARRIKDKLSFAPGYSLVEYVAPKSFNGRSIIELDLRKRFNVNVVALNPVDDSGIISILLPETIIMEGDTLWLVASEESLTQLPAR